MAVTVGTHRSEFTYDGLQRRVRMVEKEGGVTQSDTKVVWCDEQICEERLADGVTVARRAFARGEQAAGLVRMFTTDHLGSVTEVADASATLLSRFAFDPWGRRTLTSGTDFGGVGYTGHRVHTTSGLALALYRGYDAALGRWVSQDPLGDIDGPNRYGYVKGRFTIAIDPFGEKLVILMPSAEGAVADFIRNYRRLRRNNLLSSDKYFHCMANCQASNRGQIGAVVASTISEIREIVDQYLRGNSLEECNADRQANRQGRRNSGNQDKTCEQRCGSFRPRGL